MNYATRHTKTPPTTMATANNNGNQEVDKHADY
jgi:hypothetical protein